SSRPPLRARGMAGLEGGYAGAGADLTRHGTKNRRVARESAKIHAGFGSGTASITPIQIHRAPFVWLDDGAGRERNSEGLCARGYDEVDCRGVVRNNVPLLPGRVGRQHAVERAVLNGTAVRAERHTLVDLAVVATIDIRLAGIPHDARRDRRG